jgi:Flp pilus assembly protein TadD
LSFHGGNYEVLNNLAVLQIEAGEFAGATALLDRADQVASGRYETALTRAFLAQRRGNSPDVHRYAQLASQLAPEQSRPHKLRGEAFMKDGDFSAAYDSLRQAHALGDVDYQLQLKIGSVCMSLGKLGEARQSFEAAVALNATDPLAFLCLFEACMKIGDERSAARALDEARRLAPEDPRVRKAVEWIQKNRL